MVELRPPTKGERIADLVSEKMGSWGFIITQMIVLFAWVVVNTLALFSVIRFDPFPFIFMNLALSAQAAFATPLLLMSQNRVAALDRQILHNDYKEDQETNRLVEEIHQHIFGGSDVNADDSE